MKAQPTYLPVALALATVASGCVGSWMADDDPDGDGHPGVETAAISSRIPRLTHRQYQNTVRDLLSLDAEAPAFGSTFTPDANEGGFLFDNNGGGLDVDAIHWGEYQREAEAVAAYVTAEPARLDRIAGPGRDAAAFIRTLGQRAHRRPLTPEEVAEYTELFNAGQALFPDLDAFVAGARILVTALLQSPFFLYRVEDSEAATDGAIPLSDYEIASRLSFALWNTMPDAELFSAAAAGELHTPDQVAEQAARLLEDPRAEDVVYDFHRQFFDVYRFGNIAPSETAFEGVSPDLDLYAMRENELFVRDVFRSNGGYLQMLTSTDTFVNAELARIYGLEGSFGDEFVRVTLDPTQRRGVFTQVGFLASHATSRDPDPIHRGVFVAKRVVCIRISAPPDMVPRLPDPMGRTNRQNVESHTETEHTCASCHEALINPFGFPFESFDAIGAHRTLDREQPVDTTSAPMIGTQRVRVENALDLADTLAESPLAHECYARSWMEFVLGRPRVPTDLPLTKRVGSLSSEGASIRELILALVTSPAFLTRNTREE